MGKFCVPEISWKQRPQAVQELEEGVGESCYERLKYYRL